LLTTAGPGKWRSSRLALILNNHPCYGRPAGPPVICQRLSGFPASARHVRKQRRARRHHPTRDQIKAQCREPLATGRQTRATGNCDSVWRRAGECLNDGDDACGLGCAYVTGPGRGMIDVVADAGIHGAARWCVSPSSQLSNKTRAACFWHLLTSRPGGVLVLLLCSAPALVVVVVSVNWDD
jgi:hypothetical protein